MIIDNIKKKLLNNTTQLKYLGFEKDYYNYLKNGKRYKIKILIQKQILNLIGYQKGQLIRLSFSLT